MRAALASLFVAAALSGAGCGGSDDDATSGSADDVPRVLPPCAKASTSVSPPDAFPRDFPFPSGTVLTSGETPFPGQLVVVAAIPGDLQEAAAFFSDALPERGYRVGVGDAEGSESEAPFTGNGFRGKWRVNGIPDCAAVKLTLVLIEQA